MVGDAIDSNSAMAPRELLQESAARAILNLQGKRLLLINGCAIACVAIIWTVEARSGQSNGFDHWAYPLMLSALSLSAGLLLRPADDASWRLRLAKLLSIGSATGYVLTQVQIAIQNYPLTLSTYSQYSICLWLPLLYVLNFLFLNARTAVITSSGIYASLVASALVKWVRDGFDIHFSDQMGLLLTVLMSHPVYIIALAGITSLHQALMQAQAHSAASARAASVDYLTNVANRRALGDRLKQWLDTAQPCTALLLDLDRFKAINDTYGHDCGDQVLVATAQQLTSILPADALVGRWGGEEFLVLLATDQMPTALHWAEVCRKHLAQYVHPQVGTVTTSMGVAIAQPEDTPASLIKRADAGLYIAKRHRNQVYCWQEAPQAA